MYNVWDLSQAHFPSLHGYLIAQELFIEKAILNRLILQLCQKSTDRIFMGLFQSVLFPLNDLNNAA